MKHSLTMIGYWQSVYETDYPDPAWFTDHNWDAAIRQQVLVHLKAGKPMPYTYMGQSWCRFRCDGPRTGRLGSMEFTDGKYVWPEGLVHYLEAHALRLPPEVTEYMTAGHEILYEPAPHNYEIDYNWWKTQKGWNTQASTYKGIDIGYIVISARGTAFAALQEAALLHFLSKSGGIRGKLKAVEDVMKGHTVAVLGRFPYVQDFIEENTSIGLEIRFREIPFEQYQELDLSATKDRTAWLQAELEKQEA
ncbi:hypothetical protein GA0116948_105194 [Chitinophaga costaii]|uniref:Uncharacterized protein n=1 Tax=Chitinophaga costaii TaxID=1335309 RepID=A0A1C4DC04_9BACT|nr:hypothetical protein [Chitinophaga costaii]PUZ24559.1 hypothetical protein DCM91_11730 [Chitinophaga costaii]SCC28904.1 hypothetical protein GA0116948_105194 [Chitinophaga costaii]